MKISEHANYLLNEYGRLQFDYAVYYKPYGESLRNEARNNLEEYIDELEAEQAHWVMVSERLPNKSGWYLAGLIGLIGWDGGYYTAEVPFDTETGLPWRSSVRDEVYCWLDGVPELPKPLEVQE